MLIESPRHTPADLNLWVDHEEADLQHSMSRREQEAKEAIVQFTDQLPCYAGVSWGKDSVVIAHLLRRYAPDVSLMHLRPTNHNPDCDAVRDIYFDLFPGQAYEEVFVSYDGLDRTMLDRGSLDRLTDQRWYAAIREYGKEFRQRHILGIRAEESTGRRFRVMRWGLASPNACAPIGRWSTADVFAYLACHGLPVHPAYAMLGGGRWRRDRIRVAEIGDTHGTGSGREEWEREYYGDVLRRLECRSRIVSRNCGE